MKSCSKNHIEITWDDNLSCWCPMCVVKQSQDYLRGERDKFKKEAEDLKTKYEPPIYINGELILGLDYLLKKTSYGEDEVINGLNKC